MRSAVDAAPPRAGAQEVVVELNRELFRIPVQRHPGERRTSSISPRRRATSFRRRGRSIDFVFCWSVRDHIDSRGYRRVPRRDPALPSAQGDCDDPRACDRRRRSSSTAARPTTRVLRHERREDGGLPRSRSRPGVGRTNASCSTTLTWVSFRSRRPEARAARERSLLRRRGQGRHGARARARGGRTRRDAGGDPDGHDAAIDFTRPDAVRANVERCVAAGVPCVVGTTGLGDDDWAALDKQAREAGVPCLYAPNFALGAVLMMRFAAEASQHLPRRRDRRGARRREARQAVRHREGDRGGDGGRLRRSTRSACPGSSRTRKSSSAATGSCSRSATTRSPATRSRPACSWRSSGSRPCLPASRRGLDALLRVE